MALEFVAQESLGRTRNPDCEREEALGKVLPEIGAKPGDVREIFALMTPCASNFSWARTSFLTPVHAPWPKIYLSPVLFSFALSNSKSSVK